MACQFYNNNGFSCAGCCHFVKSTAVTLSGSVLTIQIPQATYSNHQKLCLCITQNLPAGITPNTTVSIQIGTAATLYPVYTKLGNKLYADSIRTRKIYPLSAATDVPSFVLTDLCKLCRTQHSFGNIPVVTAMMDSKENALEDYDY